MQRTHLGEFEEIVLLTVAILFGNAYGFTIKNEIEKRNRRKVSIGAMRTTLIRLEKKGFLTSELGEATRVRGGKRKRYFTVTPFGKKALEEIMENRQQLWQAIPKAAFNL